MNSIIISISILTLICAKHVFSEAPKNYLERRKLFDEKEQSRMLGSNITLTEQEERVNQKLIELKLFEYNESATRHEFSASVHFFKAKSWIENSEIFKFLTKLPKGMKMNFRPIGTIFLM